MKTVSLALVALLSVQALAAEPADAPVVIPVPVTESRETGIILPESEFVKLAKDKASCDAERDSLRKATADSIPWWALVVVGVVAAGAGIGAGVAIGNATHK